MNLFPKISIVTPSLNQGSFIEDTINSVISQNYPNLEYIIIDGGSTDNTLDIIHKYEKKLTFWTSEKDHGQSEAINKGLWRCSGDIIAYLNSDDIYLPGALSYVADYFAKHPGVGLVYGNLQFIDETGKLLNIYKPKMAKLNAFLTTRKFDIPQPTTFWRASVMHDVGLLDEQLHYQMDCDLFLRIALKYKIAPVNRVLAAMHVHFGSKTLSGAPRSSKRRAEAIRVTEKLFSNPSMAGRHRKYKNRFMEENAVDQALESLEQGEYNEAMEYFQMALKYNSHIATRPRVVIRQLMKRLQKWADPQTIEAVNKTAQLFHDFFIKHNGANSSKRESAIWSALSVATRRDKTSYVQRTRLIIILFCEDWRWLTERFFYPFTLRLLMVK